MRKVCGRRDEPKKSYSGGVENRNDLEHVGEQDLIEEIGVAFLETVEVDVFLEAVVLASELSQTAQTMISVQKIRRHTRHRGGHRAQRKGGVGHGVFGQESHSTWVRIYTNGAIEFVLDIILIIRSV